MVSVSSPTISTPSTVGGVDMCVPSSQQVQAAQVTLAAAALGEINASSVLGALTESNALDIASAAVGLGVLSRGIFGQQMDVGSLLRQRLFYEEQARLEFAAKLVMIETPKSKIQQVPAPSTSLALSSLSNRLTQVVSSMAPQSQENLKTSQKEVSQPACTKETTKRASDKSNLSLCSGRPLKKRKPTFISTTAVMSKTAESEQFPLPSISRDCSKPSIRSLAQCTRRWNSITASTKNFPEKYRERLSSELFSRWLGSRKNHALIKKAKIDQTH